MVHAETVRRLMEEKSPKLRPYLIEMGDEETLRDWDNSQMKKPRQPGSPTATPRVRSRRR